MRAFLAARPDLPDPHQGLKFDAYLAPRGAWGLAVADTGEPGALASAAWALVAELLPGQERHRALFERRRAGLAPASLVVAVGFDHPAHPPRLKLYLQEARHDRPLVLVRELRATLGVPGWVVDDRPVGVLTLELHADREPTWKVYLGGPDASAVTAGAPEEVVALGERARVAAPSPGWWYLTVRLGAAPRYAVNRIYNPLEQLFRGDPHADARAWAESRATFVAAARGEVFDQLRARLDALQGVRATPSATALEPGGADLYLAAWAVDGGWLPDGVAR